MASALLTTTRYGKPPVELATAILADLAAARALVLHNLLHRCLGSFGWRRHTRPGCQPKLGGASASAVCWGRGGWWDGGMDGGAAPLRLASGPGAGSQGPKLSRIPLRATQWTHAVVMVVCEPHVSNRSCHASPSPPAQYHWPPPRRNTAVTAGGLVLTLSLDTGKNGTLRAEGLEIILGWPVLARAPAEFKLAPHAGARRISLVRPVERAKVSPRGRSQGSCDSSGTGAASDGTYAVDNWSWTQAAETTMATPPTSPRPCSKGRASERASGCLLSAEQIPDFPPSQRAKTDNLSVAASFDCQVYYVTTRVRLSDFRPGFASRKAARLVEL